MSGELRRVLCVEDEPDIRAVLEVALVDVGGLEVELCERGSVAVERARAFRPDLVVLDVMMPEMDGPATLVALRADDTTRDIPAVFMTARAQPAEVRAYVALGALGVIVKPFDPMTVASELRALVERGRRSDP